jgi:hypothetical protein
LPPLLYPGKELLLAKRQEEELAMKRIVEVW